VQPDNDAAHVRISKHSIATEGSLLSQYSQEAGFDDIDLETGVSKRQVIEKARIYTINPNPISYVFVSWITSLMILGNKRPLAADVRLTRNMFIFYAQRPLGSVSFEPKR
jgi:hypothetical protein